MSSLLRGLVAGLGIAIAGGAIAVPSQGAVTAADNRRVVLGGSALPTTRAGSSVRAASGPRWRVGAMRSFAARSVLLGRGFGVISADGSEGRRR
jgi:hypothetical protein